MEELAVEAMIARVLAVVRETALIGTCHPGEEV